MSKHRSLAEALSTDPKKLDFIHGGKAKPELPKPIAERREAVAPEPQQKVVAQPEVIAEAEPEATLSPSESFEVQSAEESEADVEKRTVSRKPREKSRGVAPESQPIRHTLTQAVVPFTTRFRQSTAEALRRASLERKLAGESPNSQQEIVEMCVSSWLKANGYLGAKD